MSDINQSELKRSVLYESQESIGANFAQRHGWEMAGFYSDARKEHLSVRSSGGVVDLFHHGAVRISGSEAAQFLNGLVTSNVKTLDAGKGMRAALLTGHGKVRALCRVLNLGD